MVTQFHWENVSAYRKDVVFVEKEKWMIHAFPQGQQKANGDV